MAKIKIFVAEGCGPCAEIKKANLEEDMVLEGATVVSMGEEASVELVDVTSDAGFDDIAKYGLDGVPKAVIESASGRHEVCPVFFDVETKKVVVTCGQDVHAGQPAPA